MSSPGNVLACSSSRATGRTSRSTKVATVATYCFSSEISGIGPVSQASSPAQASVAERPLGRAAPSTGATRPGDSSRCYAGTGPRRDIATAGGSDVVGALVRDAGQQRPDLALPVAAVA